MRVLQMESSTGGLRSIVTAAPARRLALMLCALAMVLAIPAAANAATSTGAVISNGTVELGVNNSGDLNYQCAAAGDTGCPANSLSGASAVGLRYVPLNADGTAPGCLCEGWGAADAGSGLTGSADEDAGAPKNMTIDSFSATGSTATSKVTISDATKPGFKLQVQQQYSPTTFSPNVFQDLVTMTNTGTAAMTDVRYRRVMDWDVEPTAFSEWVTIQDPGKSSHLRFDSDDGFASASPLAGPTYIDSESVCGTGYTGPCTFTDLGSGGTFPTVTTPDDHGSLFDFGFGSLAVGQSKSFRIYYGATTSESSAVSALTAGGAEVYSLGESNCPEANPDSGNATNCSSEPANSGVKFGTPVTFIFGFVTSTADVSISKSVSPSKAVVGNNLTYTLAVHNNGPDPAAGVNVTDKLPTGVSFVSASTTQGTCSGTSTVTCSLGSIASGGNATVKIVARATATGKVTNTATVSTPSSDTNQSNNSSTVTSTVVAKAPPPKAKAAKISISGVPRACFASSTTIKVKLKSKSRIVSAVVKLDGKRIKKTTKKQFTVVLNAGRIHSGRHTLQVSVLNGAGKRSSRKVHVTRCAPPKVVVPRFTG